jgi:hypothetical protein
VFLLIREKRKRSILIRKRAKIPSPRPPSFLPVCFSGFARFFCGAKTCLQYFQSVSLDYPLLFYPS